MNAENNQYQLLKPVFIEMLFEDPCLCLKIAKHADLSVDLIIELANEIPEYFSLRGLALIILGHYNEFLKPENRITYDDMFTQVEKNIVVD